MLSAFSTRATAQTDPVHQGPHGTSSAENADLAANPAGYEPASVEAQAPPATLGKGWPSPIEDSEKFSYLLVDQLEYRMKRDATDTARWDVQGWYGGDYHRLWMKTEGEWRTGGERGGEAEVQALYSRLLAPFWDFQVGLRYDQFSGAGF